MPRIFDPERTDPTVKFIKQIQIFKDEAFNRLSENEIS